VLRILIVEDDAQLAATLKYLIEENAFYLVVGTADDTESALYAVDEHNPDVVHELHRALSLTEDLARTGNTSSKGTPQPHLVRTGRLWRSGGAAVPSHAPVAEDTPPKLDGELGREETPTVSRHAWARDDNCRTPVISKWIRAAQSAVRTRCKWCKPPI